ncbi:hypothetical protein LTSEINV_1431, partial [Salmonella enterica subsp. enterica serovar Inverness str. R8-3668]
MEVRGITLAHLSRPQSVNWCCVPVMVPRSELLPHCGDARLPLLTRS